MDRASEHERLPSGKTIVRRFGEDGCLVEETHGYGVANVAITYEFTAGKKTGEIYFAKGRMAGRRSYEKARLSYPDMPPADNAMEDIGSLILQAARQEQRRNAEEAKKRLAASVESRLPRPASTNWLRVIAGEKSHLVVFASRDWKVLSRESRIPMGRHWLQTFGFFHHTSVASGLVVGFELTGDTKAMLNDSRLLLPEVVAFANDPTPPSYFHGSIRPRRPPRKHALAWPGVLPPLIKFLSELDQPKVQIYNHHQ